ncbi:MAG: nucleotide exchange factor GrpE [Desulfobacterota bacterium]|nr:nucleotide exchange factor GrpE [Thermodesulfobacteriota bacterium]MDW8001788.1 nucleotide exchange factor GrpE [Deltaproteobacteria bacterium]
MQGNGEDIKQKGETLQEEIKPKEEHEEQKKRKKKDEIIEELKKTIEEKEKSINELKERLLYLQADFENYKKLKQKEKQDIIRYGNEVLIKELLPVIDNLERALDHAQRTCDIKGIEEGVRLTLNQFLRVLEKAGVTRIECVGQKFDPNLHEAFTEEERTDCEPGTVLCEFQKGYLLGGRLLRPAMVCVSKRPSEAKEESESLRAES